MVVWTALEGQLRYVAARFWVEAAVRRSVLIVRALRPVLQLRLELDPRVDTFLRSANAGEAVQADWSLSTSFLIIKKKNGGDACEIEKIALVVQTSARTPTPDISTAEWEACRVWTSLRAGKSVSSLEVGRFLLPTTWRPLRQTVATSKTTLKGAHHALLLVSRG